jgi:hypothetical protein
MLRNKALFYIIVFWATIASAQTVLLDEDFSGGTLPAGWTNTNNGGTAGQIWQFTPTSNGTITAGGISGNYAILDSDDYGSGNNQNASLLTPTFSTGIYETITLEFDYQYRDYNGGESCVVEVFDGTSWTEVFRKELGDENYVSLSSGSNLESIDITTEVGGATNAQVRFTYIGAYDWWWAVDNVKITGTSPSSTDAYLGPGGVGNTDGTSSLKFWIRTDSGVSTSGSLIDNITNSAGVSALDISETGGQRPTLVTAAVNGYDEVSFSGSNRLRTGLTLTTSNFVTNQASSFMVARADNTTQTSSVYTTDPLVGSTRFSCHIPWNGTVYYDFGTCCGTSARIQVGSLTGLTSYSLWTYDATSSTGKQLYRNGTLLQNRAGISNYTSHATQRFNLGANTTGSNGFVGDVAEVAVFKTKLNTAQRIIVDNYLSAKFGLTLNANDFYDEDTSGGNFDHNVAGIGRASDGSLHLDSQGTGIIRINSPSDLNNDEFLFWGEDVKGASYNFSSSASTAYLERLDTKWRVSKRNDLGTVTVSVNASSLTLNSTDGCNNLKLIVSNSSTFGTKTTYDLALSSGVYTATGVSFSDNDYFTIEYVDQIVVDGTQFYNGSGASNVPNTSDDCYKLLAKSTATGSLTLTENADVREVEVESGGKLVVNTGMRLQVTNGITLNGDIRLVGTSQLLQTHTGVTQVTGLGNLYKDQEGTTTNVYQSGYWTSPVTTNGSTFTIDGVFKDGTVTTTAIAGAGAAANINFIAGLDGSKTTPITISERWLAKLINDVDWTRYINPTTDTFNPGEGWNMKSTGSGVQNFTFVGIPNDGTYTSSINQNTLSLIGNPYPSAIDADQFITDNSSAITGTLYFYDSSNDVSHYRGSYTGGYATRVSGLGTPFSGGATPGQYIPIGQAFFVTRDVAGTGTITFQNSQRVFQVRGTSSQFFSKMNKKVTKQESNFPVLRVGFEFEINESNKYHRQLAIGFRGLTNNYEPAFDAEMFDRQPTDFGLKLNDKSTPFVISGVEDFNENLIIPLLVYLDKDRNVTFKLDGLENLNTDVYLKDEVTKNYYNLTENDISLDLKSGSYLDRFFITFKNTTLGVEEEFLSESLKIYVDEVTRELVIKNEKNQVTIDNVEIYSIQGQKVLDFNFVKIYNKENRLSISKLATAIYLVKLKTNKGLFSSKIVISK